MRRAVRCQIIPAADSARQMPAILRPTNSGCSTSVPCPSPVAVNLDWDSFVPTSIATRYQKNQLRLGGPGRPEGTLVLLVGNAEIKPEHAPVIKPRVWLVGEAPVRVAC